MTLDRERQLVSGHALAVIGDRQSLQAAALGFDLDPGRARIEGGLDQFL